MTTVIITRPKPALSASELVYRTAGFEVFNSPCFDVITNPSVKPEWFDMPADVWVVLSVHALAHAKKISSTLHPPEDTRVIGVGPAVVAAWQRHHQHPIETHASMDSAGVIELLQANRPATVKILTTANGRDVLKKHCINHGIGFHQINTYQRVPIPVEATAISQLFDNAQQNTVILTVTSVGILLHFFAAFNEAQQKRLQQVPLVVGAKRIAAVAKDLGFAAITLAANPSDQAMCAAVSAVCQD